MRNNYHDNLVLWSTWFNYERLKLYIYFKVMIIGLLLSNIEENTINDFKLTNKYPDWDRRHYNSSISLSFY